MIYKISWNVIIYKIIGFIIVSGVVFSFLNYKTENLNSVISWSDYVFVPKDNISNSLLLKIINIFFILFNIENITMAKEFILIVPFVILMSNLVSSIILNNENNTFKTNNTINIKSIISFIAMLIILSVLSLWVFNNPYYGDSWVLLSSLLVWNFYKSTLYELKPINYSLMINVIFMGLFFITENSILCILVMSLYFIYLNTDNNFNNLLNCNIITAFTPIVYFLLFLFYKVNIIYYYLAIIIIAFYVLYFLFIRAFFIKKEIWITKKLFFTNKNYIYIFYTVVIFFVAILIASINKKINFESYWIISSLFNKQISLNINSKIYYFVNCMFWIINILVFVLNTFNLFVDKKNKIYKLNFTNYLVVWNPISTNLWNLIYSKSSYIFNTNNIGSLFIVDTCFNKLKHYQSKKYWIWLSIILGISSTLWIGCSLFNFLG